MTRRAILLYLALNAFKVASGSFSPKVIISLVPRASQHGPLRPPTLKNFFENNLNFKGFHEVSGIRTRAGTALGTSGIITFGENDTEATLHRFEYNYPSQNVVQIIFQQMLLRIDVIYYSQMECEREMIPLIFT